VAAVAVTRASPNARLTRSMSMSTVHYDESRRDDDEPQRTMNCNNNVELDSLNV
jgi:hypothetical protein